MSVCNRLMLWTLTACLLVSGNSMDPYAAPAKEADSDLAIAIPDDIVPEDEMAQLRLKRVNPYHKDHKNRTNYADPNSSWGVQGRAWFIAIYALFWIGMVGVAKVWPQITKKAQDIWASIKPKKEEVVEDVKNEKQYPEGAKPEYPKDSCVPALFDDIVRKYPDNIALIVPATKMPKAPAGKPEPVRQEITYKQFGAMVDELAERLASLGATRGKVVALIIDRSVAQMVAVYGVLKTGAAFLPIDIAAPIDRKNELLDHSEAVAVIVDHNSFAADDLQFQLGLEKRGAPLIGLPLDGRLGGLRQLGNAREGPAKLGEWPKPSDTALLIYTSGTTGKPKGVIYDHTHLLHGSWFYAEQCEMDSKTIAFLKSPYIWAVIEWELFPALLRGGKLVIALPDGQKNPEYMVDVIADENVDSLMSVPSVLDLMTDVHKTKGATAMSKLKHVVTVGEALPAEVANRFVNAPGINALMHNFYGASESSCTIFTIGKEGVDETKYKNVPAGKPQPYAAAYIMKVEVGEDGNPKTKLEQVEGGESGEIFFGGVLAAGYFRDEAQTKAKWVDTPYGVCYKTGDLGRWRNGSLEVCGRIDRQVKVHGVRIEPEGIESAMKSFPGPDGGAGLSAVAVIVTPEPCELVAYSSPKDGLDITADQVKEHCKSKLPPPYVPKFFVVLKEGLPRLPNGKVNLTMLKEMGAKHAEEEGTTIVDSLGQMKKMSRGALEENNMIMRCYAFWMFGVLVDHFTSCAISTPWETTAYCRELAAKSIYPSTEIFFRSLGNDQDMLGFILLGAYQDTAPGPDGKRPKMTFGMKDIFLIAFYLAMACPIPQILAYIFTPLNCGITVMGYRTEYWGWEYMSHVGAICGHRWYLLFVFLTRLYLELCDAINMPAWLSTIIGFVPCFVFRGYWYPDLGPSHPTWARWLAKWVFDGYDTSVIWYLAYYVLAFHYLRPVTQRLVPLLPKGPGWAALACGTSMIIGVCMAMFHYPNVTLESGEFNPPWAAVLEIVLGTIQPGLFALSMWYLPFDLSWLGSTSLGCYIFHYYFKGAVRKAIISFVPLVAWDSTNILVFLFICGICLFFQLVVGPLGNAIIFSIPKAFDLMHRGVVAVKSGMTAKKV